MKEINHSLEFRWATELIEQGYLTQRPFIFVVGLPRSATTLMTQLIAHCFDVGFINNLMARFWNDPIRGILLSQRLLGDRKKTDFQSHYATTKEISDIHEFGYFWRCTLGLEDPEDVTPSKLARVQINWDEPKEKLLNIQCAFNKPMVFKGIYPAYHMKRITDLLQNVLWVYIHRNPGDVCVSILKAREIKETPYTWWATYPPEYEKLKNLEPIEQIAGQVVYLNEFYVKQMAEIPEVNFLTVSYQELCRDTIGVLKSLNRKLEDQLRHSGRTPPRLEFSEYSEEAREPFRKPLKEYVECPSP